MGIWDYLTSGYQGGGGIIPEDGSQYEPEIKIESQSGQPTKRTTIIRPTKNMDSRFTGGDTDLEAQGQAFNPMQLWENVSQIVDAEMITQEEIDEKRQQLIAQGSNIGNDAVEQEFQQPPQPGMFDTQMQGIPPNAAPEVPDPVMAERMRNPGASGIDVPQMLPNGGWNDQQVDTGVPTTPPMPPDGPIPHHMDNLPPQGPPPGQQLPTDNMSNPHPIVGVPPFNMPNQMNIPPQGSPPGQPPADPTAGEEYIGGQYFGEGSQRPTFNDLQTQNRQDEGYPEGAKASDVFTPEEQEVMTRAGISEEGQNQSAENIVRAAKENDGTNNVDGQDASTDPIMWEQWGELSRDPMKRKQEYLKQMNQIILGGIILNAMADAMGRFVENMFKMQQARMKFDDQQRLYNITRSVYWNENGEYVPPGSQSEAYERAIQSGASASEAAALASKHPKSSTEGFDSYYKPNPDGTIETKYVPKGSAPPGAPWTDNAANARHQAAGARGDARTAAMKDEELLYAWNQQIKQLESEGKMEEAAELTKRRDNFKARTGMARNKDSKPLQLFNALYKQRMGDSMNDPDYFVDPITKKPMPWDEFYTKWLNQYEVPVLDNGEMRKVPGYRKQRMDDPTETHAQATSQQQTMPGQMTRAQKVEVAQVQFRDRVTSGRFTVEELIEGMLRAGYTMDDVPEEYK